MVPLFLALALFQSGSQADADALAARVVELERQLDEADRAVAVETASYAGANLRRRDVAALCLASAEGGRQLERAVSDALAVARPGDAESAARRREMMDAALMMRQAVRDYC